MHRLRTRAQWPVLLETPEAEAAVMLEVTVSASRSS
jgi:hypothetical protein